MPRLARIEPAIDRLLHRVRGRHRALDTDAIARDVYGVEASRNPTASQRAVVTRAMRDFVRDHQAYALAAGRGRTALYIVPTDAERLPDWLAFPRPPIKPPPAPSSWAHDALDLLAGVIRASSHWQRHAEMPPELRAQLQKADPMLLALAGAVEDYARRPQRRMLPNRSPLACEAVSMTGIAISEPDRLLTLADAERLRAHMAGLFEAARLDFVAGIFGVNVAVIGVWQVAPRDVACAYLKGGREVLEIAIRQSQHLTRAATLPCTDAREALQFGHWFGTPLPEGFPVCQGIGEILPFESRSR